MAAKILKQPRPNLREKYASVVGKSDSVTENKATVVQPDASDDSAERERPLSAAFQKSLDRGLDPDERMPGEDTDDTEYVPPSEKKPKQEAKKPEKKEEPDEEESEEKQKPEQKKDEKKKPSLTDEEVDGIDESTLTDKQGRAPSREAWATVKLLKQKIADDRAAHAAKVEELSKKTVAVEEAEPFLALKKERDELRKKLDDKFFEESPDFINTFVKPFEEKEKEVAEWINASDIEANSPEHLEITRAVNELHKAMVEGKRTDYFKAAAKIARVLPEGLDQQLMISVTEMYPLYQKKKEAHEDKDKARKLTSSEELNQVDGAAKVIDKTMDQLFESFEAENAEVLEFYRSDAVKELLPYDDIVTKGKKEVKALIRDLIATRKPSEKLVRILTDAVVKPFKDKEVEALRLTLKQKQTMIDNLKAELDDKRGILKKLGTTSSNGKPSSESDERDSKPSSTPLTDRFKQLSSGR